MYSLKRSYLAFSTKCGEFEYKKIYIYHNKYNFPIEEGRKKQFPHQQASVPCFRERSQRIAIL